MSADTLCNWTCRIALVWVSHLIDSSTDLSSPRTWDSAPINI